MAVSCNKPHNMENGVKGQKMLSPQLSDDESVSPPSNITGAYLACHTDTELIVMLWILNCVVA